MGLFTDLCVAGLGLCDVGSYTVKNVLLTLFFELLRVPLTFRDPIMSVNDSNYLFHESTRAALDEVFGQAFERSGYSKTTVDLPGVKAKVLAYAGMDAHGERRVAVVNVICEISQPLRSSDVLQLPCAPAAPQRVLLEARTPAQASGWRPSPLRAPSEQGATRL